MTIAEIGNSLIEMQYWRDGGARGRARVGGVQSSAVKVADSLLAAGPAVVLEPLRSADRDTSAPWCQPGGTQHTATTNSVHTTTDRQTNNYSLGVQCVE